jgi:hypothetical protein
MKRLKYSIAAAILAMVGVLGVPQFSAPEYRDEVVSSEVSHLGADLMAESSYSFYFGNYAYAQEAAPALEAEALPAAEAADSEAPIPAPPAEKLEWVQSIIDFLAGIPAVGNILVYLFQILTILAVVLTALSSVLVVLKISFEQMGKKIAFFDTAAKWIGAILPWVQYASMYNVQKKSAAIKK